MIAPQLTRAAFAYKTPNLSENRRLGHRISILNCIFFPILSSNASAGTPHRGHAKDALKVSRPHDALYENPALRGSTHRITHPRQTMVACRSTDAPPFRSETAVAHRQSIRRAFEKSRGDGSSDKSLSAS
jgi:hypothetical protein